MPVMYSESQIDTLLGERKPVSGSWRDQIRLRSKRGHGERHLDLTGNAESAFRLIFRQSSSNPLDFSIILAVRPPQSNQFFRLRRYNGKSHEHTNHIEGESFYDFHVHLATERYQDFGTREDAYAEPTERYSDFRGAVQCLIDDVNLEISPKAQSDLFGEG